MKELEGKVVYLWPTGNAARHHDGEAIEATINKVARVFVTFTKSGYRYETKMRFNGRSMRGDCNSGYEVYETMEELNNWKLAQDLAKRIADKYQYRHHYEKLGYEKLKAIADIMGV